MPVMIDFTWEWLLPFERAGKECVLSIARRGHNGGRARPRVLKDKSLEAD